MPTEMRVLQQHDAGAMHVPKADPGTTGTRHGHRSVSPLCSLQSHHYFNITRSLRAIKFSSIS